MEKQELINKLQNLKDEISYQVRIVDNGKKSEVINAQEELKRLTDQAIILYKENNILDFTHPNRNKDQDFLWYKDLYGKGGVHDINFAIIKLKDEI